MSESALNQSPPQGLRFRHMTIKDNNDNAKAKAEDPAMTALKANYRKDVSFH